MLYQNDDFGKDYLNGLRDELGYKANKNDCSHPILRDHRSNRRFNRSSRYRTVAPMCCSTAAIPKFAAQSIRKVHDIGWRPTLFPPIPLFPTRSGQ